MYMEWKKALTKCSYSEGTQFNIQINIAADPYFYKSTITTYKAAFNKIFEKTYETRLMIDCRK